MNISSEYQDLLRTVPLFADLNDHDFAEIIKGTSDCQIKGGESLFSQFQPATDFFFVVKGRIKISLLSVDGTEKVVDIINEGSTFAEAIIFQGINGYPVNGDALMNSIVIKINAEKYKKVLSRSTEACFKVMSSLSARTHWLMNEMERLSLHNASFRLITYLLDGVDESVETPIEVTLSAPKHVIASRLSITPETLSRTLKNLSKKELLSVHERHIILNNPASLYQMISI